MPDQVSQSRQHDDIEDEFYVGYLPMPAGHRRFINTLVFTLFLWIGAMSAIIVVTMREPGYTKWETGSLKDWSGTLIEHPYPMLIPDQSTGLPPAIFVVSMGKRGAHDRLEPFFGHHVTLSGYELNRQGRMLIELDQDPDAIITDSIEPTTTLPDIQIKEHATIVGEIVDGKCFLGAMKPGDGMGHHSCAALCIRGGLPPMFVADTPDGELIYYLLIVDGSTALSEHVLGLIGRKITIEADIATLLGIPIIQATESNIAPAHPFSIGDP